MQNGDYPSDMPSNEGDQFGGEEMPPEEEKFFNDFTNEEIDRQDPSLGETLIKAYEEEVPFEIRIQNQNLSDNNLFESLVCKILVTDERSDEIIIKIEIANDKDLFFYYTTEINEFSFKKIKEEQKLTCNFENFCDLLIKYFDFCIDNKKKYLAVFNINKDKNGKIELLENLEYKFGELINLKFSPASKELIYKQIRYRYNSMRTLYDLTQNRIKIINEILKDNDPQLIPNIKKGVSKIKIENFMINKSLIKNNGK